ncbi:uncharacterized protein LOC126106194, partial [Schistocerca cancellata]
MYKSDVFILPLLKYVETIFLFLNLNFRNLSAKIFSQSIKTVLI